MSTKIDESRLNFCVLTGRRFYAAAEILMNYLAFGHPFPPSLTPGYETGGFKELFCVEAGYTISTPVLVAGGDVFKSRGWFSAFCGRMKILKLENFTIDALKIKYQDSVVKKSSDEEKLDRFFQLTSEVCPIDIQLEILTIGLINGNTVFIGSYPLILLLYYSDEILCLFEKFTALLLNSTHLMHSALFGRDFTNRFNNQLSDYYVHTDLSFFESMRACLKTEVENARKRSMHHHLLQGQRIIDSYSGNYTTSTTSWITC